MEEDGTMDLLPKKEAALLRKELAKLDKNLGGIKDMKSIPQVMFVVDVKKEALAISEANKLGITVIGVIDTNVDPDGVDLPIPANDDAIRSINLISSVIANAIIEGKQGVEEVVEENTNEETVEEVTE
jgi:small subunit ribosomal protein S2